MTLPAPDTVPPIRLLEEHPIAERRLRDCRGRQRRTGRCRYSSLEFYFLLRRAETMPAPQFPDITFPLRATYRRWYYHPNHAVRCPAPCSARRGSVLVGPDVVALDEVAAGVSFEEYSACPLEHRRSHSAHRVSCHQSQALGFVRRHICRWQNLPPGRSRSPLGRHVGAN